MKKILTIFSLFTLIFSFGLAAVPAQAAGAAFYFSPSTGTYPVNTEFSIKVRLNTGGESINAAEGNLVFDAEKIEVLGISKTGSIFTLWPVNPVFSNAEGTINFAGGLTNPGYTGSQGLVCEIVFKTKKVGTAGLIFSSGAVLASDGKGTNILSSIGSGSFTVSPQVESPDGSQDAVIDGQPKKSLSEELLASQPAIINISSNYDPNSWQKNNYLIIRWDIPANSSEVSFVLNKEKEFDPPKRGMSASSQEFKKIEDGIWFFHIRFKEGSGWTDTATYQVRVDTTPPNPFKIKTDKQEPGKWPVLRFETGDALSGLARFEIHIDSFTDQEITLDPDQNFLAVSGLEAGKHTAIVRAIDLAGNETFTTQEFTINPIATPAIANYSEEIKSSDQFFLSGTALPETFINVFIQKGEEEKIITKKTQSDKNGDWYFVDEKGRENGRYVVWVQAESPNGLKSGLSDRVSFLVSPPVFARIGDFVVNYFTVLVSLLFMIILIVASLLYLAEVIRKRLKKETFEVEKVVHDNMASLRQEIDKEIAELARYKGTEGFAGQKNKVTTKINKKIKVTESKIMKEVEDVEKILK